MATTNSKPKLTIHGYFRSSCSARLRIALHYKNIDFEYIPVNIKNDLHLDPAYLKINPSRTVPTLLVEGHNAPITQSLAALEYFEEAYPDAPMMPKDAFARAQVRSLVNTVVSDIQPVTNMVILRKVGPLGYDGAQWSREFHARGFDAYEAIIKGTAGKYSVGDEITMADVCLAPAVWNAERWGLDMSPYPTIKKVYENASQHPAFVKGHWKNQIDCPDDLK